MLTENCRRGLGYYRVPKPMVTELNGDRIAYADKMPNTGIYRYKIAPCIVNYIFQPIPSEEIMETVPGTMTGWLTSVGESTIG